MLHMLKNKRGQNTAEYALLIALVIAGIIAMQTYAQRSLQARVKDASNFMTSSGTTASAEGVVMQSTAQYEPYYLQSNYEIDRATDEVVAQGNGLQAKSTSSNRTRQEGGSQTSTYSETGQYQAQP